MMLKRFALNPKEIAKFWEKWGCNRPPDVVCEDTLVLENAYNPKAAPLFLRVYDETIAFAGLNDVEADAEDKGSFSTEESDNSGLPTTGCSDGAPEKGLHSQQKNKLGQGERELSTGLLSKSASFRLLVTGVVGKKEIDRLIMKLELDRDILAEPDEDEGTVLDLETMLQT
ncbi:MAG: hypothetical protein HGA87_05305 [Desulfobulbaceae bacterium]|nr:hypothetical protein [Desulfobulbaceae bacterium]